MRHFSILLNFFIFLSLPSLNAEVEEVTINWLNPVACQQSCISGLEKRFLTIQGVESVQMNQPNGLATLKWKPNVPFSFTPINWALRYVGVREQYVRVKVRGTINITKTSVNSETYNLISNGDKTKFELINRINPNQNEYSPQYSTYNRTVSGDLQTSLQKAQKDKSVVVINGTLFEPQRSPPDPLRIIVDQIQVEEPPNKQNPKKP